MKIKKLKTPNGRFCRKKYFWLWYIVKKLKREERSLRFVSFSIT